jgi:endonuclease/exonuclease/phosphatase family metal-dependent hydrolase
VSKELSDDPRAATIRVATWNVWWRFGSWKARAEAIATTLRSVNADVYMLQEVWAHDAHNLAGQLAAVLDYQWTWAASPRSDRWCRRLGLDGVQLGNAILSRWPLSDPHNELLPDDEDDPEGRLVVGADVGTPWGSLPVLTTQLNSHPAGSAIRQLQVDQLALAASRLTGHTFPPVVGGDFNAQPSSDEVRRFEGHLTPPAVPGQVLIDVWRYTDADQAGFTWDRANPLVAATFEPSARIDYIFVGQPTGGGRGHVRTAALFASEPLGGVWASDHFGVLADLAV